MPSDLENNHHSVKKKEYYSCFVNEKNFFVSMTLKPNAVSGVFKI